jgi:hypothetical protein
MSEREITASLLRWRVFSLFFFILFAACLAILLVGRLGVDAPPIDLNQSPGDPPAGATAGSAETPPASDAAPTPPSTPSTTPPFSVLGYLKQQNFDTSRFQSDEAAAQAMLASHQHGAQLQELAELGRRYSQHAPAFEQFIQQQQQQQAQPKQGWWKAPEWNDGWMSQVDVDPQTGEMKVKAGFDPSIPQKINAFRAHQRDFIQKFTIDPIGSIKEGLQELIQPMLQEHFQQNLSSYQDQMFTNDTLRQNAGWMFVRGQNGEPINNPMSGKPVMSPAGQRYAQLVMESAQMGIRDVRHQDAYARRILSGELALQGANPAQIDALNSQHKQSALAAAHQPNHSGSMAPATNPQVQPPPQNGKLTLRDMLAKNLAEAGITDKDVALIA